MKAYILRFVLVSLTLFISRASVAQDRDVFTCHFDTETTQQVEMTFSFKKRGLVIQSLVLKNTDPQPGEKPALRSTSSYLSYMPEMSSPRVLNFFAQDRQKGKKIASVIFRQGDGKISVEVIRTVFKVQVQNHLLKHIFISFVTGKDINDSVRNNPTEDMDSSFHGVCEDSRLAEIISTGFEFS